MLKIYLTNLGKYNEGELIGKWIELPISDEDLEQVKKEIGINEQYEEWFITDFDTDISGLQVGEYDNLSELNEIAERIDALDDGEREIVEALMNDGYTLEDAIGALDDCIFYSDCNSMEDVAYQIVNECGYLENVPDTVARYFDYEAFGRDLDIEGHFIETENGIVEVLR